MALASRLGDRARFPFLMLSCPLSPISLPALEPGFSDWFLCGLGCSVASIYVLSLPYLFACIHRHVTTRSLESRCDIRLIIAELSLYYLCSR